MLESWFDKNVFFLFKLIINGSVKTEVQQGEEPCQILFLHQLRENHIFILKSVTDVNSIYRFIWLLKPLFQYWNNLYTIIFLCKIKNKKYREWHDHLLYAFHLPSGIPHFIAHLGSSNFSSSHPPDWTIWGKLQTFIISLKMLPY